VTDFRDPSCSGADTGDMANAQNVNPGPNPPQLDRLDAGTQLVTLRIGGNDIGFSEIIQNCASLTPTGPPLNGVLADVAAANGAAFVDAYTASIGHDACRLLGVRWVEPAIPASPGAPVHPKLFGV
jgi:hypothetical protein